MSHATTSPEKDPLPPDEFDRLEEMHRRMIESQEAWRRLLENLDRVTKRNKKKADNPETEKPSE
jgi:hypothetical protein